MARSLVSDFRIFIHDNSIDSTKYAWTNVELTFFLQQALDELNVYALTSFDITTLQSGTDAGDQSSLKIYNLCLAKARLLVCDASASDPDTFLKTVTQDTQIDPSSAAVALARLRRIWGDDYEKKFQKFIGSDFAGYVGADAGQTIF